MAMLFNVITIVLIISLARADPPSSTKPSYKELIQNHTIEDYNYLRLHNPLQGRKHKRQLETLNDLLAEMAFPNSDFKRDLHSGSSDLTDGDLWYRHFRETEKHSQFENANNDKLSRLTRQSHYENSNNNPTVHINVNEVPVNYFEDSDDNDDLTIRFDRNFHGELLPLLDEKENLNSKNDNLKYEDQLSSKKNTLLNEPDQKLSKVEQDESENQISKKPNIKPQKPIKNSPKRHITSKDEIKILKSKLMLKRFDRDKIGPISQMPNNNVNIKKIHKDNSNPFWYQNEDEAKIKEKENMLKNYYNRRKLLSTYESDPIETEFESDIDNKRSFEYDDKGTDTESIKNLRNVEIDEFDESNVNGIINKRENDEIDSVPNDFDKKTEIKKPVDSLKGTKIDKSQLPENLAIELTKDPKKLYNINIFQNISKDPQIDLNGVPITKNKRNEIKNDLEGDRTNPVQTFQNFLNDIITLKNIYKRESLNEELENEFTGKMANKIAQEIVNLARSNILLRQYFEGNSELELETRQVLMNNQTKHEGFHKIESMLQQIIETINSKPEQQQSCTPLPKDLQEFYDQIIEVRNINYICRQQKKLNTNMSNKISKRHNSQDISPELMKKVLKNYDQRSISYQNDLKQMVKINHNRNIDDLDYYSDNLDIKKRMNENDEKIKINYENFSKNNLTEQFLKLSKTVKDYKNLDIIRDF